jgi:hypothetical protein
VHYAVAELGAVVVPGAALDTEVRRRGQTVYLPDGSVPLHPPVVSEDAASLLPDGPRAAVLWRLDLDGAGEPVSVEVHRAVVRSRARLDYAGVQASVDAGNIHPAIAALPEVGPLRRARRAPRGDRAGAAGAGGRAGAQRRGTDGRRMDRPGPAAPRSRTGTRRSRCSPAPRRRGLCSTPGSASCAPSRCGPRGGHRTAGGGPGLGIDWPRADPGRAAVRAASRHPPRWPCAGPRTSLLRGAGYTAFDTAAGARPPADPGHAGIGATYAHVTAPLRRLVDRFGTEVRLAVTAGAAVPDWLRAALPTLPATMAASDAVAGAVARACVDRTEAALLADRVGAQFDVVVLRASTDTAPGEVYLHEPPVLARCTGALRLGETARVRLVEADPTTGRIAFTTVG